MGVLYGSRDVTVKRVELRLSSRRKAVSGYSSLLHSFRWLREWTGFHLNYLFGRKKKTRQLPTNPISQKME